MLQLGTFVLLVLAAASRGDVLSLARCADSYLHDVMYVFVAVYDE